MNPRTLKETRALLPAFCATVLITLAVSLVWRGEAALEGAATVFALCCTIMGAISFGSEFHCQTMPLLLSQPLARREIWFEKMRVLGMAVALSFIALLLCIRFFADGESIPADHLTLAWVLGLVPVGVLCTTPYWVLFTRNTIIATAISFLYPVVIWLVFSFVGWLFSVEDSIERHPLPCVAALAAVYCAAGYWLGYARFMRFQAVDSRAADVRLPAGLEAALARPVKTLVPGYTGPVASLIRKELQLQGVSYSIAGFACVVAFIEALLWGLHHSVVTQSLLAVSLVLCVFIIPLVATGVSVAEERSLGVAGWQLALPPSALKQWIVKLLTALTTSVLLGLVLPVVMLVAGELLLFHEPIHFRELITVYSRDFRNPMSWELAIPTILDYSLGYLLLLGIALFASSISSNSFRAILLTLGLAAVGAWLGLLATHALQTAVAFLWHWGSGSPWGRDVQSHVGWFRPRLSSDDIRVLLLISVAPALALPAALAHFLAFSNYRNGEMNSRRHWLHASVILLATTGSGLLLWIWCSLLWLSLRTF